MSSHFHYTLLTSHVKQFYTDNADGPEKKPMTIKRETSQISAAATEH